MVRNLVLSCVMALPAMTGGTSAATLTIDSVAGTWTDTDVVGGPRGAITGLGTDVLSWGVPVRGSTRSSYDFDGLAPQTRTDSGFFLIGAFTHKNGTIWDYSQMAVGAELTVDVSGNLDGTDFAFNNVFSFTHFETPNAADPCPEGPTGNCGDLVTIASLVSAPITVVQGDTVFTLFIDGFVTELGGPILSHFLNSENRVRQIYLQGRLEVGPAPVPVPPSLAVMAAGFGALAGLGALRSRRQRTAK